MELKNSCLSQHNIPRKNKRKIAKKRILDTKQSTQYTKHHENLNDWTKIHDNVNINRELNQQSFR